MFTIDPNKLIKGSEVSKYGGSASQVMAQSSLRSSVWQCSAKDDSPLLDSIGVSGCTIVTLLGGT